jgi:hypothetical protein
MSKSTASTTAAHIRPENRKEDRIDRRLAKHQTGTRRVVVAFRQRKGRTLTFVTKNEAEGVQIAKRSFAAWRLSRLTKPRIGMRFTPVGRRIASTTAKPTATAGSDAPIRSKASSARLRRMVRGQHHFVSPKYLYQYANHAAWLEDHRRRSNGGNAFALLGGALNHPVSRVWAGYWQRTARAQTWSNSMGATLQNFAIAISDFRTNVSLRLRPEQSSDAQGMSISERRSCERATLEMHAEAKAMLVGRKKKFL